MNGWDVGTTMAGRLVLFPRIRKEASDAMDAPEHARTAALLRRTDGATARRIGAAAEIFRDHARCVDQARQLLVASREHSGSIAAELAAVRLRLMESRAVLERSARASAAARTLLHQPQDLAGASDAPSEAAAEPARSFAAITELVAQIEQAASRSREPIDDLIVQVKLMIASEPDAGIAIGVLVEGVAQALRRLVPEAEQLDMLVAAMAMLRDRTLLPDGPPD